MPCSLTGTSDVDLAWDPFVKEPRDLLIRLFRSQIESSQHQRDEDDLV